MKIKNKLVILFSILFLQFANAQYVNPLELADPNIGTVHSRWFFYTPGSMPFGMAKPAPSTNGHYGNKWGWEAVGYDGTHKSIEGFANFHEFQVGGIVLMPTVGELKTVPGKLENPDEGYRSRFEKKNEHSKAGYYSVILDDYKVKAELTATPRVAFHRYTFPKSSDSHIVFDIGNQQGESGKVSDASVQVLEDGTIQGFVITLPNYAQYYQPGSAVKMYFVAKLNKKFSSVVAFNGEKQFKNIKSAQGNGAGLVLNFETEESEAIEVKIGLSYTSIENAKLNLVSEASDLDFDKALEKSQTKWKEMLSRISIKGGSKENQIKFYTGLYHALLGRGLSSDVNGQYNSNDGSIKQIPLDESGKPQYNHYNTDATWGTFWNLTQLWALAYPDYYSEFVRSQLDIYQDSGWLADGVAASKFVSGVGTNYMGVVIASAYTRGIRDFDIEKAYKAVRKNEVGWNGRMRGVGKADTKAFIDYGFVPQINTTEYYSGTDATGSQFSASHTLEYSFSAYSAAQFAKDLGKDEDYKMFMKASKGWEYLFDDSIGFIRPKTADGKFIKDFDPKKVWTGFQEGNSWQYTFYIPHDINGLIGKIGKEQFNNRLDAVFKTAKQTKFGGGEKVDAFAGLENVYNHGNQPSLHISWLYNYSGEPYKTQYWVREICKVFYGTNELHGYGYGQDEDQGQLGAWMVLGGIGLFDVQGGTSANPTMQISTPLFSEVVIKLHSDYYQGKEFKIVSSGNTTKNTYIKRAKLNGKNLNNSWIDWKEITSGGELKLKTSTKPNKKWGVETPPPSLQ